MDSCKNPGNKVQSNGLEDDQIDIDEPGKDTRHSDDFVAAKKQQCNSLTGTKLVSFIFRRDLKYNEKLNDCIWETLKREVYLMEDLIEMLTDIQSGRLFL